jgi:hypothetical protein
MNNISKSFALLLTIIIAMSCLTVLMIKPTNAQTPTPSVPTFTMKLGGNPVRVNTTYSLDSTTGQIVPNVGYTNQFSLLELTVKNQPSYGSLYYNVRVKNHNSTYWQVVGWGDMAINPKQSADSDQTEISLNIEGSWGQPTIVGMQTDVQVQAMLGGFSFENNGFTMGNVFSGTTSSWSDIQTISVPSNIPLSSSSTPIPTSSSSPTSTPTATSISSSPSTSFLLLTNIISLIVIAILLAVIIALLLLMRHRKTISLKQ